MRGKEGYDEETELDREAGQEPKSPVDDEIREKIMEGSASLTSASGPRTKALWVKNAMQRMDSLLNEKTRIEVMERCSCDFEVRKKEARKIYEQSVSIDDFIQKMGNRCNKLEREGNILYSIKTILTMR
jgi:hypothetical protein